MSSSRCLGRGGQTKAWKPSYEQPWTPVLSRNRITGSETKASSNRGVATGRWETTKKNEALTKEFSKDLKGWDESGVGRQKGGNP